MKNNLSLQFSNAHSKEIKAEIKHYFSSELEIELGDLQADFLVDFIKEHIGKYFYNQGVLDAKEVSQEKLEDLALLLQE